MPWFKGTINNRLRSTDSVDVAGRMNPEALSIAMNAEAVTTATVERLTAQMDALRKEAEMKDRQIQFSNQERDAAAATAAKYAHITENALRDRNVLLRAHAAMDADLLATQEAMLLQGAELAAAKAEMKELKDFKDQTDRLASGGGVGRSSQRIQGDARDERADFQSGGNRKALRVRRFGGGVRDNPPHTTNHFVFFIVNSMTLTGCTDPLERGVAHPISAL